MKSLVAALALALSLSQSALAETRFTLEAGGGTVIHLGESDETGNAFGGILSVRWNEFSFGFGAAAVMPDARLQGRFSAIWGEVRYHFLRAWDLIEPYGVVAVGGTTEDGFKPSDANFLPVRWSPAGDVLVLAGAGLRLGRETGMSLALDIRAVNMSHLTAQLLVGLAF